MARIDEDTHTREELVLRAAARSITVSRTARLLGLLVPVLAVVTLPLGLLTALVVGLTQAAVVFVVGWLLLVPLAAILAGILKHHSAEVTAPEEGVLAPGTGSSEAADTDEGPVEVLRDRYARGEIDEAELERRLDALLELDELDPDDEATVERVRERLAADESAVELGRE
jgi:uncharacterized membrane protein